MRDKEKVQKLDLFPACGVYEAIGETSFEKTRRNMSLTSKECFRLEVSELDV
jgi:hypothetical protein